MEPHDPTFDFIHAAYRHAHRLGHHWIGNEHLVLALLNTDAPEARTARNALEECGITGEAFEAEVIERLPDDAPIKEDGFSPTPRTYTVLGRAEGLALAQGRAAVDANDVLIAILWEPQSFARSTFAHLGANGSGILAALAAQGVTIPAADPLD
jgi:ATP-dependent Clp protease ATP-binding subunit ClpA